MSTQNRPLARRATLTGARPIEHALPIVAGVAYTASWVAGLLVSSSSTDVDSTGGQVLAAVTGHEGAVTAQYLLTEGAAALFLALVTIALAGAARRTGARALGRVALVTGLAATLISLVQCAMGGYLTRVAVPAGNAGTAGTLTAWINHLDGIKMFVLAGFALAAAAMAGRARVLPGWLGIAGWVAALALVCSGAGYLFTVGTLATLAYVSLPLLLVLVTGSGVVLAGRSR